MYFLLFEDNPREDNQTTVERLVEETCPSSPTPVFNSKRKARKLVFPRPTLPDSEEEDPNTATNQMKLDSEAEMIPQKGKEREKPQWNRIHIRKCHIPKSSPRNSHNI
ncbi:hypothetical protein O181_009260 [Austropuccinia psidii MF-1]|uniref:Uncharacterized protein n=1 Tax=Austropuccinia psidii MF-1 TaxID=1389203 RepID=A0A9Q3BRK0_9BASI|nr:hypothetical protein [Austropuccinia psidii MF-1]